MSANIITITREFGSGGRSIGRAVAAALGYEFYDWSLVGKIAAESGFAQEFVEDNCEDAAMPWLFRSTAGSFDLSDQLFLAQRRVILELAEKGRCVIVGRCADYILRERTDVLSCFVFADDSSRIRRIEKEYGKTDVPTPKRMKDKDRKRKAHYQYYTGRKWGRSFYYDLSFDTGRIDMDLCASLIVQAARNFDAQKTHPRED